MGIRIMDIIGCPGFTAAGVAAGLKKNGKTDLGLIYSIVPATVAGVFTRNRIQAAPVVLDRERVATGTTRAVIVNSGNANCCTGDQGLSDARTMAATAAAALGVDEAQVLVASTGVIGQPLPVSKVTAAVPALAAALSPDGFPDLAAAIMTTDTVPKLVTRQGILGGKTFTVTGVAKGAGMIRPDMATMLCFVCTDAGVAPDLLRVMLTDGVDRSFNRISIDGDTSTNDTVLLMAGGVSGIAVREASDVDTFQSVLDDVLMTLARMVVKDGEGATKVVEVKVRGAVSEGEARRVADTIAHSPLVKTAIFGEDANWGRIIAAAGRSGVAVDPARIDIFFDGVQMVKDGTGCGAEAEAESTRVLRQPEFTLTVDLRQGEGAYSLLTCDFSIDYVKINADYRS